MTEEARAPRRFRNPFTHRRLTHRVQTELTQTLRFFTSVLLDQQLGQPLGDGPVACSGQGVQNLRGPLQVAALFEQFCQPCDGGTRRSPSLACRPYSAPNVATRLSWGFESRLRGLVVLVDQAAEYLPALHRRHDGWLVMVGWPPRSEAAQDPDGHGPRRACSARQAAGILTTSA
jgi:hypothetical protein